MAVRALQKANGLPQTGWMDKATDSALQVELASVGGAAAQQATSSTAAVQQTLKLAGYWDGPGDRNGGRRDDRRLRGGAGGRAAGPVAEPHAGLADPVRGGAVRGAVVTDELAVGWLLTPVSGRVGR